MGVENQRTTTTLTSGQDMRAGAHLYHAVALDDGQVAANGEEAIGILLSKPDSGEYMTVGWHGEMKFAAGGAIAAGGKITVSASGWFTAGDSGDYIVGECKSAVTSGSNGTGLFSFPTAAYLPV